MLKKHLFSTGALGVMIVFAFGSVGDLDGLETEFEEISAEVNTDAEAKPAGAASGTTGIAECDEYIKRYRCFLEKMGQPSSAADQMEKTWSDALGSTSGAGADIAKKAMADSCKQSLGSIEAQFTAQGC